MFNVTDRNCSQYLDKCLKSIINQKDSSWVCVVTDDASDDSTWEVIEKYQYISNNKIKGIRNSERLWKARNFHFAMTDLDPHTIVIELDGDDHLIDDSVVSEIRRLHKTYDLVWSQHEIDKKYYADWHSWQSTSLECNWTRNYPPRNAIWNKANHPGHLRTFKKFLYDAIPLEDFMIDGKWVKTAFDSIYYTALVEMTESRLRYFYDRSLAVYNILPHNDTFLDLNANDKSLDISQSFISDMYCRKKPYTVINRTHIAIFFYSQREFIDNKSILSHLATKFPFNKYHIGIAGEWNVSEYSSLLGCKFYNIDLMKNSAFGNKSCDRDIVCMLFLYYLFRNNWTSECMFLDGQILSDNSYCVDELTGSLDDYFLYHKKLSFNKDYMIIEEEIKNFKRRDCSVFGRLED